MADDTARAEQNIDESKIRVGKPKTEAVGAPAVIRSLQMSVEQMGVARTAKTLLKVNQVTGFDCMGCAWPDPDHRRHTAEFCENGAKAVAEEATTRRVPPAFFAAHPVAELEDWDDFALGKQGRLTHPMLLEAGDTHYRPVTWERAFDVVAEELDALDSPTRPSSTRRGAPPTRRRSSTSCSSVPSARTTCPTARTCATSRAAPP
jgi:anaerobic selenocysteine-containing dehydrogenase